MKSFVVQKAKKKGKGKDGPLEVQELNASVYFCFCFSRSDFCFPTACTFSVDIRGGKWHAYNVLVCLANYFSVNKL